jgi:hypothetical protein
MWNHRHLWLLVLAVAVVPAAAAPTESKASLKGAWEGEYSYPGDGRDSVKFEMTFKVKKNSFTAKTKEPNTFSPDNSQDPHLFANCKGTLDPETRKVTWTKTYDGTGGYDHSVEYSGTLSKDGKSIEGTWVIKQAGGDYSGTFKMKKGDR